MSTSISYENGGYLYNQWYKVYSETRREFRYVSIIRIWSSFIDGNALSRALRAVVVAFARLESQTVFVKRTLELSCLGGIDCTRLCPVEPANRLGRNWAKDDRFGKGEGEGPAPPFRIIARRLGLTPTQCCGEV